MKWEIRNNHQINLIIGGFLSFKVWPWVLPRMSKLYWVCATKNNQSIYFQHYPYLKRLIFLSQFGPSGGCRLPEVCMEIDPDARDWDREIEERIIQRTREYIQHHFPYLDHHEPTIVETCIYTVCVESQKLTQGSMCLALPSSLSWVWDLLLQLKIFYLTPAHPYYLLSHAWWKNLCYSFV